MAGTATATIKVKGSNGKNRVFKKVSCHSTKTEAKSKAVSLRNGGSTARMKQTDGKWCVFKGPKAKAPFGGTRRKKTTAKRTRRAKR